MQNKSVQFLAFGLGFLLLFHGVDKLSNGVEGIEKMLMGYDIPYAKYLSYGVYIGEIFAPLMLLFGQYIRMASTIIAFNMLVAIVLSHKDKLFTLGEHGAWSIELPMLYLIIALSLTFWKK